MAGRAQEQPWSNKNEEKKQKRAQDGRALSIFTKAEVINRTEKDWRI